MFASSVKMFGWVKAIFEPQLAFFHRYGLNRAAMFAVGVIEATGASLITLTSIGAMFFHFRFDTWKDAVPSMVTLLLSLIIALPLLERLI